MDYRHVTADTVSVSSFVFVAAGVLGRVTDKALFVVEPGVAAFGVLVRSMASGTGELAGGEAMALLKT